MPHLAIHTALDDDFLPIIRTATSQAKYEVDWRNMGPVVMSLDACQHEPDFLLYGRCRGISQGHAYIVGEVLYTSPSSRIQKLLPEYSWNTRIKGLICIDFIQPNSQTNLSSELIEILRASHNGQPSPEMEDKWEELINQSSLLDSIQTDNYEWIPALQAIQISSFSRRENKLELSSQMVGAQFSPIITISQTVGLLNV